MRTTPSEIGDTTVRSMRLVDMIARPEQIRDAWFRVRAAAGGPGLDGLSVDVFKRNAEARLEQIRGAIETRQYVPNGVRRVKIPKSSGGWRLLGIPTVVDRIVQTATAMVLQDHLSPSFSSRSFAYRPLLGPRRAAIYLHSLLPRFSHALTADIEKFFDNVEHSVVARQLRASGVDEEGVGLVLKWLRAPVVDGTTRLHSLKGIPQGAPVSPVIANMYLTGFDRMLEASGCEHVRYADDFIVMAETPDHAAATLRTIEDYLCDHLQLNLKVQKTQYVPIHEGFQFVGFRFAETSWTVPEGSIAHFKESISTILKDRRRELVLDVAKHHNDLVRGWRNYYSGNSPEMDRQLEYLDAWRQTSCDEFFNLAGVDPILGRSVFETFALPLLASSPRGTYADDSSEEIAEPPPPFSGDAWRAGDASAVTDLRHSHSSTRQLRSLDIAARQQPAVLTGRFLRIPTYGAFVTRTRSILAIRRKKQVVFECPFSELSHISIESDGVVLSTRVMEECAKRRISMTISRISGVPIARILPARSELQPGLAERQVSARVAPQGTAVARAIVSAKIANQRALLLYHAKYDGRDVDLRRTLKQVAAELSALRTKADAVADVLPRVRTRLFLIEARAAALYWGACSRAVPKALGFTARRGRGAEDLVNKLLNFGYWSLHLRVWSALEHAGLDPRLGLLHTSRRKTPGLVFDAMEEFRQPLVDRVVLSLIGRGSRLELNGQGNLTSRTRALAQRAFARALERRADGSVAMLQVIRQQARALARALANGTPYQPYRYIW